MLMKKKNFAGSAGVVSQTHGFIAIAERNIGIFDLKSKRKVQEIAIAKFPSRLALSLDENLLYYTTDSGWIGLIDVRTWEQVSCNKLKFPTEYVSCEVKAIYGYCTQQPRVLLRISCQDVDLFGICNVAEGALEILLEEADRGSDVTFDYHARDGLYILGEDPAEKNKGKVNSEKTWLQSGQYNLNIEKTKVTIGSFDTSHSVMPLMVAPQQEYIVYCESLSLRKSKLVFLQGYDKNLRSIVKTERLGILMQKRYIAETQTFVFVFDTALLVLRRNKEGKISLVKRIKTKYATDCLILNNGKQLLLVTWEGGYFLDIE